jgi:SSS family solute:Na+ symporter
VVIMVFGVVWAATLIAHSGKPVFIYLLNAYGYFTPGIATMFLLGILWRRTTHAGALTAGALTIPMSVVLERALPGMPFRNRTGITFWACMATCALVSVCTRPRPDAALEGLIWSRDSLRLPLGIRGRMRGIRSPALWWAVITAVLLAIYVRYR